MFLIKRSNEDNNNSEFHLSFTFAYDIYSALYFGNKSALRLLCFYFFSFSFWF